MTAESAIVAVVENEFAIRRAMERLLRACGYEPAAYPSAESYLGRDDRQKVACLVLDINLGGMSGLDLQRRLTERGNAPPIVFITGHTDQHTRSCAAKFGYVAYLEKPFESSVLIDAIETAMCVEKEAR